MVGPVIPPTLREKTHYIAFQVVAEKIPGETELKHLTYDAIMQFLGEFGASLANPKFLGYDSKKNIAILRCSTKEVSRVRAALALVTQFNGQPIALRSLRVSGTIKKLLGKLEK